VDFDIKKTHTSAPLCMLLLHLRSYKQGTRCKVTGLIMSNINIIEFMMDKP